MLFGKPFTRKLHIFFLLLKFETTFSSIFIKNIFNFNLYNSLSQNFWHEWIIIKVEYLFLFWLMFIEKFYVDILKAKIIIGSMFYFYSFVYLFTYLFIYLFIHSFIHFLFICFIYFFIYLFIHLEKCLRYHVKVISIHFHFRIFVDWLPSSYFQACTLNSFVNTPNFLVITVDVKISYH